MSDPYPDPAAADRQRLDKLLRVDSDAELVAADPDPSFASPGAEWVVAYEDQTCGVHVSVAFVRDPAARDAAARSLMESGNDGEVVSTNGGMLFFGRLLGDSDGARDMARRRLVELATRFAGEE